MAFLGVTSNTVGGWLSDKINLQFADVSRVGNDLRMILNLSA